MKPSTAVGVCAELLAVSALVTVAGFCGFAAAFYLLGGLFVGRISGVLARIADELREESS